MKKTVFILLCVMLLLCFASCGENTDSGIQSTENTTQSETNDSGNISDNTEAVATDSDGNSTNSTESAAPNEDESIDSDSAEVTENNDLNVDDGDITDTAENTANNQNDVVFNTNDIKRITFYAYYGTGIGSDVPAESLAEITAWLDSFKIDVDRKVPEVLPPGTNTIHVEIEYSDGSIIKCGMDTAVINGATYYISGDSSPECYDEIISKTSLG